MEIKDPREILKTSKSKFAEIYTNESLRDTGGTLANFMMNHSHAFLEKISSRSKSDYILELGANDDSHLKHIRGYSKYLITDAKTDILQNKKIDQKYPDIEIRSVDASRVLDYFRSNTFDRVIACNLLEHLPNPEKVLLDWYELIKPGGVVSLLQPCDPGIMWRIGRNLGPRKGLKSKNINYDLLMSLEHINPINNILNISSEVFPETKFKYFPFNIPSWNINLFVGIEIRKI